MTVPASASESCAALENPRTLRPKNAMASTTTGTLPSMMSESFHEATKMKIRPPTRMTLCRTACGTVVSRVSRTTPRSAETRLLSAPARCSWKYDIGRRTRCAKRSRRRRLSADSPERMKPCTRKNATKACSASTPASSSTMRFDSREHLCGSSWCLQCVRRDCRRASRGNTETPARASR